MYCIKLHVFAELSWWLPLLPEINSFRRQHIIIIQIICIFMTNSVSYFIQGVIRVHLLEAENLVQKDNFLGAIRGKSDPYALLRVGTVQYRSKTVSRDLNPIWNETFEVLNLLIFPSVGYTAIYTPVLAGPSLSWLHWDKWTSLFLGWGICVP